VKAALDEVPAQRKIRIVRWQGPNGMQVIGQNADRDRLERIAPLSRDIRAPKPIYLLEQKIARSVRERHGEEKGTSLDFGTTVACHGEMMVCTNNSARHFTAPGQGLCADIGTAA
jgi:hypothetical protein